MFRNNLTFVCPASSKTTKQLRQGYLQFPRDQPESVDFDVDSAPLQKALMGPVNAALVGEGFLRHTGLLAHLPNSGTKPFLKISIVGILRMPNCVEVRGFSSTFSLAIL